MRIALFHNATSGGVKRAIFEWTRRLAENYTIDVYTLSTADHDFCDIRPFVQHHHISKFPSRRLFASPWGRLNQLQRWRDLIKLSGIERNISNEINTKDYDVVFVHYCQFTVIPILIQHLTKPTIYYLHEPIRQSFTRNIARPYFRRNQWRDWLDRIDPLMKLYASKLKDIQQESINQTGRLLANSHFTLEQMNNLNGLEASICHLGVDHRDFTPVTDVQKGDFVLSVGELSPRKGFDFLVESLGQIPALERPKLKLACNVVQDNELGFVQEMASQHQVDLEVLTNQNTEQLMHLYNRARLCVFAPIQEPFGLVPLEAMSCGTPVIGVNEGGVRESVVHEQTGLLIEREPGMFAAAVRNLLSNPTLANLYGRNGREHILRNWTWEQSTNALEEHLISCADGA